MTLTLSLPDLSRPRPAARPAPPDASLLAEARVKGEADGFARGYGEGLAEGARRQKEAQDAAVEASLAVIAAELRTASEHGAAATAEAAEALAALLLATLDALACTTPAREAALAATIAQALLPALSVEPAPRIRVAAEFVGALGAHLPATVVVEGDPTLPAGDAQIEWPGGACRISFEQRREAVRLALEAAGFRIGSDGT
jgi:flagellar biosynthesis/type III secretory pathway protein FliH